MKFLVDMGVSPHVCADLRAQGYDCRHIAEEGLERLPDRDILSKAREEHCVLLTHDLDFAELVAIGGTQWPSVIIFRLRNMRPDNIRRYLNEILRLHGEAIERGALISVTEGQARIRQQPL